MLTKDEVQAIKEQWEDPEEWFTDAVDAAMAGEQHVPALCQTVEELRGLLVTALRWLLGLSEEMELHREDFPPDEQMTLGYRKLNEAINALSADIKAIRAALGKGEDE